MAVRESVDEADEDVVVVLVDVSYARVQAGVSQGVELPFLVGPEGSVGRVEQGRHERVVRLEVSEALFDVTRADEEDGDFVSEVAEPLVAAM